MALIKCPECGKEISDKAVACINCGFPLSQLPHNNNQPNINKDYIPGRPINEPVITESSPASTFQSKNTSEEGNNLITSNSDNGPIRKFFRWLVSSDSDNTDNSRLVCAKCNSSNIKFEVEHVNQVVGAKSEVRKKSIVTRTGNRMGRSTMMLLTGGLWGLVPKRSDYNEITKVQTQTFEYKTAVCQNCGYSWPVK